MITGHACDAAVCIRSILLYQTSVWSSKFRFKRSTYSMLDFTSHRLEKLNTDLSAGWVVLNKEDSGFPGCPCESRIGRRIGVPVGLNVDGLRGSHFLHGVGARIVRHRIRNLVDVIRVERIDSDSLTHRVYRITVDVVHWIMHHGH